MPALFEHTEILGVSKGEDGALVGLFVQKLERNLPDLMR